MPPTLPLKIDPQLARFCCTQIVERGKNHLGVLSVVAANLAQRSLFSSTRLA